MTTPSLCFTGVGLMWPYYTGVSEYVIKNLDVSDCKLMVVSGGVYGALPILLNDSQMQWAGQTDVPHKFGWRRVSRIINSTRKFMGMYPLIEPTTAREKWRCYLPPNAHEIASGRLFLSITQFPSFQNVMVSEYPTREYLIDCLIATMNIPGIVFPIWHPTYIKGLGWCIDGGFSNNAPVFDKDTIIISPDDPEVPKVMYRPWFGKSKATLMPNFRRVCIPKDLSKTEVMDRIQVGFYIREGIRDCERNKEVFLKHGWRERNDS